MCVCVRARLRGDCAGEQVSQGGVSVCGVYVCGALLRCVFAVGRGCGVRGCAYGVWVCRSCTCTYGVPHCDWVLCLLTCAARLLGRMVVLSYYWGDVM